MSSQSDRSDIGRLLRQAIPFPANPEDYVTRGELHRELEHVASAIENSADRLMSKVQRWLIGIAAFFITTFGAAGLAAYTTAIRSLEEIKLIGAETRRAHERLDDRSTWIGRMERWNGDQDATLHRLDPSYKPKEFEGMPK